MDELSEMLGRKLRKLKEKSTDIKLARKIESRKFELDNLQELLFPEKNKKPRDFGQIKDNHTRRRL